MNRHQCTSKREEYEPRIDNGIIVYAGVDYKVILREAEKKLISYFGMVVMTFPLSLRSSIVWLIPRPGHEVLPIREKPT